MREDLLRSEGDSDGLLVGDLVRLVVRVGVQGLRSSEDGGEGLHGGPDDVHLRLLGGKGDARGLRVKTEEP